MTDSVAERAQVLVSRAANHGVQLIPGEPVLDIVTKLVDRLDKYRDKPEAKGRILID